MVVSQKKGREESSRSNGSMYTTDGDRRAKSREMQPNAILHEAREGKANRQAAGSAADLW